MSQEFQDELRAFWPTLWAAILAFVAGYWAPPHVQMVFAVLVGCQYFTSLLNAFLLRIKRHMEFQANARVISAISGESIRAGKAVYLDISEGAMRNGNAGE